MNHWPIRLLLCLSLFALRSPASAQRKSTDSQDDHQRVYQLAMRYADYSVAVQALYYRLAADPTNVALKDSLAMLYLQTNSYAQAILVGQEVLQAEPKNERILKVMAVAYSNLGMYERALNQYKTLYEQTGASAYLFQKCVMDYNMERYGEFRADLNELLNKPGIDRDTLQLADPQGRPVAVTLPSAALNLLGLYHRDRKEIPQAIQAFEASLKASPNNVFAEQNLANLQKSLSAPQPKEGE